MPETPLVRMLDTIRRIAPRMLPGERRVLREEADAIREASAARAAWRRAGPALEAS